MKTILITGANRGIGLEVVKQYHASGWRVIACCRDPEHAKQLTQIKDRERLSIIKLDVGKPEEINQLSQKLKNESIDILLNNAGIIISKTEQFGQIDFGSAIETLKINSVAPLMVAQALIDQVKKSELKIIANMSSLLGSIGLMNEGLYCNYSASKAALNSISKNMAIALKSLGVTVVTLSPGWVKTDMGGPDADISVEESVAGLRKVLNSLRLKDSGSFLDYQGKLLTW